jgi:hypothetical protein
VSLSSGAELEKSEHKRRTAMRLESLSKFSLPPHFSRTPFSPNFTIYNLVPSEARQPWIMGLYDVAEPRTDPHYHRIKTQTYIMLEGETTLCMGEKTVVLKAGQVATIPPYLSHVLEQEKPIRFLVIEWPNIPYPGDHFEEISEAPNTDVAFVSSLFMTGSSTNQSLSVPTDSSNLRPLPPSSYQNRIEHPSHTVYEICQDFDRKWSIAIIDVKDSVPHFHKNGTEHFIVLSGQLKIELGNVTHILSTGQSVHIASEIVHHLGSANNQLVRIFYAYFPAFRPDDFHLTKENLSPPSNP